MSEKTSLLNNVGEALRDHGIAAAITALVRVAILLLASLTRKALTNDSMLDRLNGELAAERTASIGGAQKIDWEMPTAWHGSRAMSGQCAI